MKAIQNHAWAGASQLTLEDIPSPSPGPGEIKIGVEAAGVYFGDALLIAGLYQMKPPLPFTPGTEAAGTIIEVGEGVTGFAPGDRVVAVHWIGAFAEEMVALAGGVFHIPDTLDYATAAAIPLSYGTSHLALTRRGHLQPGEVLLVHGAAGGVGLTAVELGKKLGATVIATASTQEKLDLAAQYGADHLINYKEESFKDRVRELTGGRGADVIYDPVGGDVFDQSLRCINWEGRLLVIGFASGRIPDAPANLPLVKNFSIVGVFWGAYAQRDNATYRASLETLLDWAGKGEIRPHISKTYPLAETPDALMALVKREAVGKLIIDLSAV